LSLLPILSFVSFLQRIVPVFSFFFRLLTCCFGGFSCYIFLFPPNTSPDDRTNPRSFVFDLRSVFYRFLFSAFSFSPPKYVLFILDIVTVGSPSNPVLPSFPLFPHTDAVCLSLLPLVLLPPIPDKGPICLCVSVLYCFLFLRDSGTSPCRRPPPFLEHIFLPWCFCVCPHFL